MPLKLRDPRPGRSPYYEIRGTYLGIKVEKGTGTSVRKLAEQLLKAKEREIERGAVARPGEPTFEDAAERYINAGGDPTYLWDPDERDESKAAKPLLIHFANTPLSQITQAAIDDAAAKLYPNASIATRNRQVYTPVSAVLKRAGDKRQIERPIGWRGKKATSFLEPDQAFAVFAAADRIDPEFGLLCRTFLYTGMRENELLSRKLGDLKLERAFLYLDDSKNGDPRGCHLPPFLVKAFRAQPPRQAKPVARNERGHFLTSGRAPDDVGVPFLKRDPDAKLFRFHNGGRLRAMLKQALQAAGLRFPRRQGGFHLFCHTYGSWMHRFGELDTHGLTRTGRWADPDSADRYVHTQASEEARRADWLPTPRARSRRAA
jgi:integrase